MSTLKNQFDLHTRLFNNVLDGIEDPESNVRPNEHANHLKWIAGHLTSSRYSYCEFAKVNASDPYADLFWRGTRIDPAGNYPSIEEIRQNWNAISGKIGHAFEDIPAEVLEASTRDFPIPGGTVGAYLDFMMHHEAYHIGQMGILRKILGKEAMKYS